MIRISDMTMKQTTEGFSLSFREKIELAKLLDKLGTSVIEVEGLHGSRSDMLRIKSIAAAVNDSIVSAPVELNAQTCNLACFAMESAFHVSATLSAFNSTGAETMLSFTAAAMDLIRNISEREP